MSPSPVLLQSHHVIEQTHFEKNNILIQLVKANLIDPHSSKNRLYLPFDDALANDIDTSPHRGKTASSYTRSVGAVLDRLALTDDGRLLRVEGGASPEAREAALRRIAEKISDLQDTIKVALVNGDAFPTIPGRIEKSDAVQRNHRSIVAFEFYASEHPEDLTNIRAMGRIESEWAAVTRSEASLFRILGAARDDARYLVSATGELPEREIAGRIEMRMAVAHAQESGRLTLSDDTSRLVKQILVDDLPAIGTSKVGTYDFVSNPPEDYKPLSQRRAPHAQKGFFAPEVFFGELHAGKAAGVVGLALVAQEFAVTGHKWLELKIQGNTAGADATVAHFVGPNVGGAVGGFLLGASVGAASGSFTGPLALISGAGGGVLGAYLGDKWAEQRDIKRVFNQEDQLHRVWSRDPADPDGRWYRGAHEQRLQSQDLGTGVEVQPLKNGLGEDVTLRTRYIATGAMERYLNWKAAGESYELGLYKRPVAEDPYRLSATDEAFHEGGAGD